MTIGEIAARYDDGNGEGAALHAAALRRLAWRARRGGKTCSTCSRLLPLADFGRDSRESDGLFRVCRACRSLTGRTLS